MQFERMQSFRINESLILFDVYMSIGEGETIDRCYIRLQELLQAYYGGWGPQVCGVIAALKPNTKEEDGQTDAGVRVKYVPDKTLALFRGLVKNKYGFETDTDADNVLKILFGVDDLAKARMAKALSVLEQIANSG